MAKQIFNDRDLREMPAYGIPEAAGYLRLPVSTLRAWLLGQRYRVGEQPKFFKPVIDIADRKERQLSFINLVEAFVLAGIRREHEIPLPKVRKAVDYLRRTFNTTRPLAHEQFETDGIDLFVEKMGSLIGATQEGQIQMRDIIRDRLERVHRDPKGVPEKIVLFPARRPSRNGPAGSRPERTASLYHLPHRRFCETDLDAKIAAPQPAVGGELGRAALPGDAAALDDGMAVGEPHQALEVLVDDQQRLPRLPQPI